MKKILFITTRNPYSGRFSGDVLRASRVIKLLKGKFHVDVVFLDKKIQSLKTIEDLKGQIFF